MAADYDEATLLAMMMDDIGIERRNAIVTAWDENDREITTDVARQEEAALQSRRRPLEHANPQALQAWNGKLPPPPQYSTLWCLRHPRLT